MSEESSLVERISYLERENLHLSSRFSLTRQRLEETEHRNLELETSRNCLTQEFSASLEQVSSLEKRVREADRLNGELRSRVQALSNELTQLQQKTVSEEQHRTSVEQEERLRAMQEVTETRRELGKVHDQLRTLQASKAKLESEFEELNRTSRLRQTELERCKTELSECKAAFDSKSRALDDLQSRFALYAQRYEDALSSIDRLKTELHLLRVQSSEAQSILQSSRVWKAENEVILEELRSSLQREFGHWRQEISNIAEAHSLDRDRISQLERTVREKSSSLDHASGYVNDVDKQTQNLVSLLEQEKNQHSETLNRLSRVHAEVLNSMQELQNNVSLRSRKAEAAVFAFMKVMIQFRLVSLPLSSKEEKSSSDSEIDVDTLLQSSLDSKSSVEDFLVDIDARWIRPLQSFIQDTRSTRRAIRSATLTTDGLWGRFSFFTNEFQHILSSLMSETRDIDGCIKGFDTMIRNVGENLIRYRDYFDSQTEMLVKFVLDLADLVGRQLSTKDSLIESLRTALSQVLSSTSSILSGGRLIASGGSRVGAFPETDFEEEEHRLKLEFSIDKLRKQLEKVDFVRDFSDKQMMELADRGRTDFAFQSHSRPVAPLFVHIGEDSMSLESGHHSIRYGFQILDTFRTRLLALEESRISESKRYSDLLSEVDGLRSLVLGELSYFEGTLSRIDKMCVDMLDVVVKDRSRFSLLEEKCEQLELAYAASQSALTIQEEKSGFYSQESSRYHDMYLRAEESLVNKSTEYDSSVSRLRDTLSKIQKQVESIRVESRERKDSVEETCNRLDVMRTSIAREQIVAKSVLQFVDSYVEKLGITEEKMREVYERRIRQLGSENEILRHRVGGIAGTVSSVQTRSQDVPSSSSLLPDSSQRSSDPIELRQTFTDSSVSSHRLTLSNDDHVSGRVISGDVEGKFDFPTPFLSSLSNHGSVL